MRTNRIDAEAAQRAVVIQLLRDDHAERWSRTEIERTLADMAPLVVDEAIGLLADAGVAIAENGTVLASRCARHLDMLGLIAS